MKAYAKIPTEELINRIKAGDQEAFKLLIVQYEKLIWKMIHDTEVGKSNDAEDIFQEVCSAIWRGIRKIKQLDPRGWDASVQSWIRAIVHNKCVDYSRSKQRREVPHSDEEIQQFWVGSSRDKFKQKELNAKLHDAIAELSEIYREAVELHYLYGWKIDEIATMEDDLVVGTIKSRLHEARKKLRASFGPSGMES